MSDRDERPHVLARGQSLGQGEALRVLDGLLEGCQIIGRDWRYLYVNDAVVRHARKPREELLGRSFAEIWTSETRPAFQEQFGSLRTGGESECDLNLERKNGQPLTVRLIGRVQRNGQGRFVRTHCILHDLTEREHAEARLRENEERLRMERV